MDEARLDRQEDSRLAERLLRGGVGLRHVRRTLRELRDHREDLVQRSEARGAQHAAANAEARQMLGDHEELVARMLARPELRSRTRRFAWLLFVLGPLPMVFAVIFLLTLMLYPVQLLMTAAGIPAVGRDDPELEILLTRAVMQWISPAIVALILCRAAALRRIPSIWPVCAMVMVSLGSACIHVYGMQRVSGIHVGWFPQPDVERAVVLFCAFGGAYLSIMRGRQRVA